MTLIDYRTQAHDAIWAALEASSEVTDRVRVGNRVNLGTAAGWLRSLMERAGPGDYPRIQVDDAGLTSAAYAQDPAFGAEELDSPDGFSAPVFWGMNFRLTIQTTVAAGAVPMAVYGPLESAVFQALVAAGPRLLGFNLNWRLDTSKEPAAADLRSGLNGWEGIYKLTLSNGSESRDIIG